MSTAIGQYLQGHVCGSNDIDGKCIIDALYLGKIHNGSDHTVFKLSTKEAVSVNHLIVIAITEKLKESTKQMGKEGRQPDGSK